MTTHGTSPTGDYVVLLHGLGRTHLSMTIPRLRLRAAGFEPVNVYYPSRRKPIPELAGRVAAALERRIRIRRKPVHFLTHSLGGIVLRAVLSDGRPELELGNVVMLAPPNQGSRLAERFGDNLLYRAATGPAGQQVRADSGEILPGLDPIDYEVGVIAGSRASGPWALLTGVEGDGTVGIDETALEGMADFLVVPKGHTFIMNDPVVIDQAIHFFRNGRFRHESRDD